MRLKDRKVNSLESALNPENYSPYEAPEVEKVLEVVTKKKTKNDEEESVKWSNQEPMPRAGRRPATQVRRVEGGLVQQARDTPALKGGTRVTKNVQKSVSGNLLC